MIGGAPSGVTLNNQSNNGAVIVDAQISAAGQYTIAIVAENPFGETTVCPYQVTITTIPRLTCNSVTGPNQIYINANSQKAVSLVATLNRPAILVSNPVAISP
ncbi:MAG: hypothetical protein R3B54_09790 [Bdellovibrionota bacterium]